MASMADPMGRAVTTARKLKKVKILFAFQAEGREVEHVEFTFDYFHSGIAYVVLYPGMPRAEHYDLGQASMDMLRLILLERPDFFQQYRRRTPAGHIEGGA